MAEDFRKEQPSETAVFQEGQIKNGRIRLVIIGILPYVNITKQNRDGIRRKVLIQVAQRKAEKKWRKRICCLTEEFEKSGCVFQKIEPPKSMSISRKSTQFLGPKRSVHFSKGTVHDVKIRERKGLSQGVRNKSRNQSDAPAEMRGKWSKVSTSSKKRTKPHSTRFQKLVIASVIFEET